MESFLYVKAFTGWESQREQEECGMGHYVKTEEHVTLFVEDIDMEGRSSFARVAVES